jgi:hypothetical protein
LNDDFFFSAPQLKREPLGARVRVTWIDEMTRRTKIWLAVAGTAFAALVLVVAAQPMCACTPALNPVAPPSDLRAAVDTLAVRQEIYYRTHGGYADKLGNLGIDQLFAAWDPRMPIANDRGFDLVLSRDSISCTYLVRRVTDDTTVGRRVRCYAGS